MSEIISVELCDQTEMVCLEVYEEPPLVVEITVSEKVEQAGGEVPDVGDLQKKRDDSLTTHDKTVVGAINELNAMIGDINSILDAINGQVI